MQFSLASIVRIALLVLVTAFCFSPVIEGSFSHIDDDAYVYRNDHVREGLSLENIGWALQSIEVSNWHPLTWYSYMLDVELFGVSAAHMHGMNLLIHLLNCLLLFALIKRLLSLDAALIASLVFAIHPLHVETVAWISQRKELLSFFFILLSAHGYLSYRRRGERWHYLASLGAFCCALMSKPMAVSFPVLLILLDYWPLQAWPDLKDKSHVRRYVLEKLPFVVLAAVACVLALVAHSFAIVEAVDYSLGSRLILVVMAYIEYLRQFFFPLGLNFYYPVPELGLSLYFWVCLLLFLGLSWGSIVVAKRYPVLFVAWWWYVIALLPVIGVIKVGGQFVADRYTYLPLTGVVFAIGYLVHQVSREERFAVIAGSLIVLSFCGMITYDYARSWQHDISIARRAIFENPDNPIAYYVLVKGVEVRLTQQVLDALAGRSDCIQGELDVFAGVTESETDCLAQTAANEPANALILAAQHFRDYELNESAAWLATARSQVTPQEAPGVIYFSAIQNVLSEDRAAIEQSINELRSLTPGELRSAALFLGFYQIGNLDAANVFLGEVLESFDRKQA